MYRAPVYEPLLNNTALENEKFYIDALSRLEKPDDLKKKYTRMGGGNCLV